MTQEGVQDKPIYEDEAVAIAGRAMCVPAGWRSRGRTVVIGVDIGLSKLRMVKMAYDNGVPKILVDHKCIAYTEDIFPGSPDFPSFLKDELGAFCGRSKRADIWATSSAASMNVRQIQIPRVPKRQIPNAFYWSYKKEVPFDDKESIFDYEIISEELVNGAPRITATAFTVSRDEVEALKNLFSGMGFPLAGITFPFFAVRNLFTTHWLRTPKGTIGFYHIGSESSRLTVISKGKVVLSRSIRSGIDSLAQSIRTEMEDAVSLEEARKILFSLGFDFEPLTPEDAGYHLSENEIFDMLLPALQRLLRQTERTLSHLRETHVEKIYISGELSSCGTVLEYLLEQIGVDMQIINPFDTHLGSVEVESPDSFSDRALYATVTGLALSDRSYTPNLLYAYDEKQKESNISRMNNIVFVGFMMLVVVSFLFYGWQNYYLHRLTGQQKQLTQEFESYQPMLDEGLIKEMALEATRKASLQKEISQQYLALALISDVLTLTSPQVRLTAVDIELGPPVVGKEKERTQEVLIEGVVSGAPDQHESLLTGYMKSLATSSFFSDIALTGSRVRPHEGTSVMSFDLELDICLTNSVISQQSGAQP